MSGGAIDWNLYTGLFTYVFKVPLWTGAWVLTFFNNECATQTTVEIVVTTVVTSQNLVSSARGTVFESAHAGLAMAILEELARNAVFLSLSSGLFAETIVILEALE